MDDFDILKQIIIALRDKDIGEKIEDHIDAILFRKTKSSGNGLKKRRR